MRKSIDLTLSASSRAHPAFCGAPGGFPGPEQPAGPTAPAGLLSDEDVDKLINDVIEEVFDQPQA